MAVLHCDGVRLGKPCRTLFAVGLTRCPHCKSRDHHEFGSQPSDEEHPMAKITRTTGPSSGVGASAEAHEEGGVPQPDVVVVAAAPSPEDDLDDEAQTAVPDEQTGTPPNDDLGVVDLEEDADGTEVDEDPGDPPAVPDEPDDPDPGPAPEETPADFPGDQSRPIVNAKKADWVTYATSDAVGIDREVAEDEYSKADLIKVIDRIEAGTAVVVDGRVVLDTD